MSESARVLYLDLVGGVAGDMLLAALLDAGADLDAVERAIASLELGDVELRVSEAHPAGLRARRVEVFVRGQLADRNDGVEGGAGMLGPAAGEVDHVHGRAELARANAPEPRGQHLHVLAHRDRLEAAEVVVVVAGMEGALPSVVKGLISRPLIAVPTSVGVGA
ncbi:DUF111 family protein, partial [Myxococcota bacterium]|nr:DUF111 family protein [Myxococcota bacterium]